MKTSTLLRLILALVCILIFDQTKTFGQDDPYQKYLVHQGGLPLGSIAWSHNGYDLVFQKNAFDNGLPIAGVNTAGVDTWYEYSADIQQITSSDTWQLQPTLTSQQRTQFQIADDSFVFTSPNNRYLVYALQPPPNQSPASLPLAVADTFTNQYRILSDLRINTTASFDDDRVFWNSTSSDFVFGHQVQGGGKAIFHVSNLNPLSGLVIRELQGGLQAGGTEFYARDVLDVAENSVLLYGKHEDNYSLLKWNVTNSTGQYNSHSRSGCGGNFSG